MRNRSILLLLTLISYTILITTFASGAVVPPSDTVSEKFTTADVIALILYIILALLFSFLCSVAEAVLLNITPSYIADLKKRNEKFASKVNRIRMTNIDQSLAAILTMNTVAHTVGAIGSGAKATIVFGSTWFGLFTSIMTLLLLFLSEIIPKTIGVVYWRKLTKPVILYIQILNFTLYPMIWISENLTKLITKGKSIHGFNRDEFVAMAGMGAEAGAFDKSESRILVNLFRMGSLTAEDIYTPRTVILGFEENLTVSEVFKMKSKFPFSRLIIYNDNFDNVTGFILKDELFLLEAQDKGDTIIKDIKREIKPVSVDISLSDLLEVFLHQRIHITLVVDEFGTKGIVTIEDVLETLLGIEIIDESDEIEDMQKLAKDIWEKRMKRLGINLNNNNNNNNNN